MRNPAILIPMISKSPCTSQKERVLLLKDVLIESANWVFHLLNRALLELINFSLRRAIFKL